MIDAIVRYLFIASLNKKQESIRSHLEKKTLYANERNTCQMPYQIILKSYRLHFSAKKHTVYQM